MTTGDIGASAGGHRRLFGKLLRALGFRWVFPIGTMPIPYHPLLAWALLIAAPVWLIVSLALSATQAAGQTAWLQMLIVGLLLGVPMSIPIIAWMAMVFRVPLIQSLLFASAMVLLAIEVALGRAQPALAALPAGYLGLWLYQWLGGQLRLQALKRDGERFERVTAGQCTVFPIENSYTDGAKLLADGFAVRCRPPQRHGMAFMHRLTEADARALLALGPAMPLPGWNLEENDGFWLLQRPAGPGVGEILIERQPYRDPLKLVTGELYRLRIQDGNGWRERIAGRPQVVSPLPLAMLFYWVALFGGKSQWVAGFARRRVPQLGDDSVERDSWPRLLLAPAAEPDFERDQLDEIMAAAHEGLAADAAAIARFWPSIAQETGWPTGKARFEVFRDLQQRPALLGRDELTMTLAWLERARDAKNKQGVGAAASLLQAFDEPILAQDSARLMRIFNSRVLGLAWKLTPDLDTAPLPNPTPRFGDQGGYGLITSHPKLYEKLARLGPNFEALVKATAAEALKYGWKLTKPLRELAEPPTATG
jgi:hypothetical protein